CQVDRRIHSDEHHQQQDPSTHGRQRRTLTQPTAMPQQSEEPRRLADNEPQASQVGGTRRQLMARWRPKNRKATNGQARQSAAVPPERALQGLRSTFAKQARGLAARSDRFSQLLSRTSESEF